MSSEELKIIINAIQQGAAFPWWAYLLFLVFAFLGSYLGSYFKKKGENLATKEDINDITQKIESIKAEILFSKELEKQYLDRKIELLLTFFDHITEFNSELLAVSFGNFLSDGGKSLYEYQTAFYRTVVEIAKSYQRLVVFIDPDSQILHHAEQVTNAVLDLRKIFKHRFGKVKITSTEEWRAFSAIDKDQDRIDKAVQESNMADSIFWDEMRPKAEEFRNYFQKFISDLNIYVKPKSKKAYQVAQADRKG